ncbi:hypothetical protein PR202_ga11952 [Eleusine coracana subsp. coracana]|uniref:Phosphoribulokinase/uridine kinase domain-containing protein n=1 Tax=Eleusine coracana subsp. coracana TaxID=191504 RepID=A0AAV5CAW2_ELECO|nr:hypothetical protein PR202_ga11952 [Eleusine coracana subsp. coracana]
MELSSSVASTAAQARLLRPPSGRRSGLPGNRSLRFFWFPQSMKVIPPISATFQQAFAQAAKEKKKQNVPCYQRQEAPQIEAKYIVGVAGPPGAGKSTVASEIVRRVNMLWSQKHAKRTALFPIEEIAAMLPMDGFHLYRSQLDAMEGLVCAPSFDHGVGDPVENDISVKLQHKIVIVEGNYLLLDEDVWREIRELFDEKWFIDVDIDVSMQRVLKRHIATGKEPDVAAWRISYNDRPNAELIMQSRKNADLVIRSVDFSS